MKISMTQVLVTWLLFNLILRGKYSTAEPLPPSVWVQLDLALYLEDKQICGKPPKYLNYLGGWDITNEIPHITTSTIEGENDKIIK